MDGENAVEQPTSEIETVEGAGDCSFGLMRMDGALLALPVEAIREVIPGHRAYSPMPVKAQGLRGAVNLRGATIPVLDLRETLGLRPIGGGEHVIVIVRWHGRLIGLIADEVCGIARMPPVELFLLEFANAEGGSQLATHTFQNGDDVATVLSARKIAELPNLPMVAEKTAGHRQTTAKATESVLLFTCGLSHFGINATYVDATVPNVRIERNALASGFCLGVVSHHGFEVPVVQTRAAIGIGFDPVPVQSDVIIVRFSADAMLGFVIDEVRDIARIAETDILRLPAMGLSKAPLFRGMLADASGREHLLLDMDRVRSDERLMTLATLRKPKVALQRDPSAPAVASQAGATAAGNTKAFLTYVAGAERATPLTQVSAILTYPENIAPFEQSALGMLGLFTYRGRVVPLICLASIIGRPCALDQESARVLIVDDGTTMVGFVVQALRSIETVSWHSPPANHGAEDQTLFKALVLVGLGDQRRMMSHVDLLGQTARFHDTFGSKSDDQFETALVG